VDAHAAKMASILGLPRFLGHEESSDLVRC